MKQSQKTAQAGLDLVVITWSAIISLVLLRSIKEGTWGATIFVAWVASPLSMFGAVWFERYRATSEAAKPSYRRLISLKAQSWAFLFGDTVCLPFTLAVASASWPDVPGRWYQHPYWGGVSLLGAVVFAAIFRKVDVRNYKAQQAVPALLSPAKQVHDFVAVPVLFAGLLFGGVPLIIEQRWTALTCFCLGLGGWVLCGIADVLRGAMCRERHVAWDTAACRPIAWQKQ